VNHSGSYHALNEMQDDGWSYDHGRVKQLRRVGKDATPPPQPSRPAHPNGVNYYEEWFFDPGRSLQDRGTTAASTTAPTNINLAPFRLVKSGPSHD
jgi:hypothetical protein